MGSRIARASAVTLGAMLLAAAPGAAAPGPVDPEEIAQAERIDDAVPFVSPIGEQLVFWRVLSGPSRPMEIRVREGGEFSPAQTIDLTQNAELPRSIAFDPDGNAFIPWGIATNGALGRSAVRPARGLVQAAVEQDPCTRFMAAAYSPAGELALACSTRVSGSPSDQTVFGTRDGIGPLTPGSYNGPSVDDPFLQPQVAWGRDGTLAIAWTSRPTSTSGEIRLRMVSPSGSLATTTTIASAAEPSYVYLGGLAVHPDGTAVVAVNSATGARIYRKPFSGPAAAPLTVGGATTSVTDVATDASDVVHFASETLTEPGPGSPQTLRSHTLTQGGAISPGIEILPAESGRYLASFDVGPDGSEYALIQSAAGLAAKVRRTGEDSFGAEMPIADASARWPGAAVTPAGDFLVAWTREAGPDDDRAVVGGIDSGAPPALSGVSAPDRILAGSVAQFSATATDSMGIRSIRWKFGDGTEATGGQASHAYGSPGSYVAEVTATDRAGNTTSERRTVTVSAPATDIDPPAVSLKVPRKVKFKTFRKKGITVSATAAEPNVTYAWSIVGRAKKAKLARAGDLVLAERTRTAPQAGTLKLRLKPKRSLLGSRRRSLKLRVVLVARDAAGNERTVSQALKVRR